MLKDRAPSWITRLPIKPIDRDMYRYIPPCTDVLAEAGSWSLCILAQVMRLGLVGIGKTGRLGRTEPKPRARLAWSGLALKGAWAPHPIPNCK